ncbi:MAG: hypothetical protein WB561_03250 [Terracidiphilus sp.]
MEQFVLSLLQRRRCFDLLKVGFHVIFFFRNRFENEDVALDMDVGLCDLPDLRRKLAALNIKGTAGLELAQQPVPDFDVADKLSFQADDAMLVAVDLHIAFHPGKHACFEIRRMKLRIRPEMENDIASLFAYRGPDKRVGKDLEKFSGLLVIMLTAFALAGLRVRIVHEGAHLLALLILWECLSITLDNAI